MSEVCEHCNRKFARRDHLRRHITAIHDRGQATTCKYCRKSFSRADSCRRHQTAHEIHDNISGLPHFRRTKRACTSCVAARAACRGVPVCARCASQGLECIFGSQGTVLSSEERFGDTLIAESSEDKSVSDDMSAIPSHNGGSSEHPQAFDDDFNWVDNINWLPLVNDDAFSMFQDASTHLSSAELGPASAIDPVADLGDQQSPNEVSVVGEVTSPFKYVGGDGGRESLQKPMDIVHALNMGNDGLQSSSLAFPSHTQRDIFEGEADAHLSKSVHSQLVQHFVELCCSDPPSNFENGIFPSLAYCNERFQCYKTEFGIHLPLIHNTSLGSESVSWILALATITIGASFDKDPHASQSFMALSEFLRRSLLRALRSDLGQERLPYAQASLLLVITQEHLGSYAGRKAAFAIFQALSEPFTAMQTFSSSHAGLSWDQWILNESANRLVWYSWLTKAMCSGPDDRGNLLPLPSQDLPLPCVRSLWDSNTAQSWTDLCVKMEAASNITLRKLIRGMYMDHRIPLSLETDNACIIAYLVLARTEEVAQSVSHVLYGWSPSPLVWSNEPQPTEQSEHDSTVWLPANVEYAAWRNSACDCLDLVHWNANSRAVAARGYEPPDILHLHLARLRLICPYKEMTQLAERAARGATSNGWHLPPDSSLSKWLSLDGCKARLSIVHAGAIFWFCRRYAVFLFYEPFAIYLATLTLYFYGVFSPSIYERVHGPPGRLPETSQRRAKPAQQSTNGLIDSEKDKLLPTSILLDRPCDDEMVQAFVRRGYAMRAKMSGSGSISSPFGRKSILEEGIKLLSRLEYTSMEKAKEYSAILSRISENLEHEPRNEPEEY